MTRRGGDYMQMLFREEILYHYIPSHVARDKCMFLMVEWFTARDNKNQKKVMDR